MNAIIDPLALTSEHYAASVFIMFQGLKIGFKKDLKALFSNGLDIQQSAAVRSHLIDSLGCSVAAERDVVSLHVTDDDRGTSHTLVFDKRR